MQDTNPLLSEERGKSKICTKQLAVSLYTKETLDKLVEMFNIISKDPILGNFDPNIYSKSRKEQIESFIPMFARYHRLFNVNLQMTYLTGYSLFPGQSLLSIHRAMFIPCIEHLASDKQREQWLPQAQTFQMIGCYAQSEIGHGSDVMNLETTATFDPSTDEFVLNTPHTSSIKFWPGDLGVFATHAVVYAQMFLKGKSHGVQPFLMQVRDRVTHDPLPGITVGDIGPKFGFATKDNGFMKLENVRIPRENLFGKYAKVTKAGEFKKLGNEKAAYAVMMAVRSMISCDSYQFLSIAMVNAIRFSLIRTQFQGPSGAERRVLDYQLQALKLLPNLADCYVFGFASHKIRNLVDQNSKNVIEKEDFSLTNETHIVLCATKAFISMACYHGIERARLACGGHGFSHYSGIPLMRTEQASFATLEGETTVMYLQVARFLIKNLNKLAKGQKLKGQLEYLNQAESILADGCGVLNDLRKPENLRKLLIVNSFHYARQAAQDMMGFMSEGISMQDIWNKRVGILLSEAAQNHTILYIYDAFLERLSGSITCERTRDVLSKLGVLFVLNNIIERPLALIESGYINRQCLKDLDALREEVLREIRPHAAALTDAFSFPDFVVKSAAGRGDGKFYETMFEWAKTSTLNTQKEKPFAGWEYIKEMRNITPKI